MAQVEARPGKPGSPEVSDLWPRLLISPLIGLALPNLSGLIDNSRHSAGGLLASYAYFTFVALLIWEGNRWLYFRMQRREDWLLRPSRRLAALLAIILLYSIPAGALLIWIWQDVSGDRGTHASALPIALLGIVTVVVIITHTYETLFLLRDWESDRLRGARTEKARLEAELEALGREVDLHFLFNNLTALLHLVETRQPTAPAFINALSATYRYVLESRGRHLVPLAVELDSLRRHETLAALRFGEGIVVRIDVDSAAASRLQLPPVTLAELFQNAIKHNAVSADAPLTVCLSLDDIGTTLRVENDIRPRRTPAESTRVGLRNLSERVKLATGREVTWGVHDGRFIVRVPLIPLPA
jgi:hypothetical protein